MANAASAYAELLKEKTGQAAAASPSAFDSPYAGEISRLVEQSRPGSYESPYRDRIEGLLERAESWGSYESPYRDRLAGLLDRAGSWGSYESPYREQEDSLLSALGRRASYVSPYAEKLSALWEELESSRFTYDPAADPAYQAARRDYLRDADRAVSDVLAKASAATGGRPSSWAVSAASQAAGRYRASLSQREQELFDAAYRRYYDDYAAKLDRFRTLTDREDTDYSRWAEEYSRLASQLGLLRERDKTDYDRWADGYDRLVSQLGLLQSADETAHGRWAEDYALLTGALDRLAAREDTDHSRWAEHYALLADRLNTLRGLYDSDYDKWYGERSDAYDRLVNLITATGYAPTDEELSLAGMTRAEADRWIAYYNSVGYYSGGRSSSGRSRSSGKSGSGGSASQTAPAARTGTDFSYALDLLQNTPRVNALLYTGSPGAAALLTNPDEKAAQLGMLGTATYAGAKNKKTGSSGGSGATIGANKRNTTA